MAVSLKGKSFLAISDLTTEQAHQILRLTETLKVERLSGRQHHLLPGKVLGMIFQKASTRTRVSFEVGIYQLGGTALYLSAGDIQLKRGETIGDTAQVLSRYLDGIMARTYAHQDVVDLAAYGTVPVINGLTDYNHPCQGMTDYYTIFEKKQRLEGLKIAYVGDGNNMAHSLMAGAAQFGMTVAIGHPKGYAPQAQAVDEAQRIAKRTGGKVVVTEDPVEAVKGADVVYTDVWASMGQEAEHAERLKLFKDYQVNEALVAHAKGDFLFMHCLPAHRGEEVSAGVIDGPHSVVFDQAENRLHTQKAIMALTMGG